MSTGTDLYPTHSCFDDALEFFTETMSPSRLRATEHDYRVVHALCIADGEPYAHAWVAQLSRVLHWQAAITSGGERVYHATRAPEFLRLHHVQQYTRYTVRMAMEANVLSGHRGPWRKEYAAACVRGDGPGRIVASGRIHPVEIVYVDEVI